MPESNRHAMSHRGNCSRASTRNNHRFGGLAAGLIGLVLSLGLVSNDVSAGNGAIAGSRAEAPSKVDLTAGGTLDWVHWGVRDVDNPARKDGVTPLIGNFTSLGSEYPNRMTNATVDYGWTDGAYPNSSDSRDDSGIEVSTLGAGFRLKVPAGTSPLRLKLYLGVEEAKGKLVARLSDGSAPSYVTYIEDTRRDHTEVVTLDFQAGTANASLVVDYTLVTQYNGSRSEVRLEAVTLQTGPQGLVNNPPQLPAIPDQSLVEGDTRIVSVHATDPEGSPVRLSASGLPTFASFTDNGNGYGSLRLDPRSGDAGTYTVTVTARDNGSPAQSTSRSLKVVVTAPAAVSSGSTTTTSGTTSGATTSSTDNSVNATSLSRSNYRWDLFQNGTLMFVDRTYTYGSSSSNQVPAKYAGMTYLMTAKDDRTSTGSNWISFRVDVPVTVFVAHRNEITNKPAWLGGWTDTGEDFVYRSIYRKDFPAGTVTLGGNTADGVDSGSMYLVFMAPQSSAPATGSTTTTSDSTSTTTDSRPVARDDAVATNAGASVKIRVLDNDAGLADTPVKVSLASSPSNGSAAARSDGTIDYYPRSGFEGTDSFLYRVQDADGDIATATVRVTVGCGSCNVDRQITVSWAASSGSVDGYRVYYGATASGATQEVANVANTTVTLGSSSDLGARTGDTLCFRVRAYNSAGSSGYSNAICSTL